MNINLNNLAPEKYTFWLPPEDRKILVGPEQVPIDLPQLPLPIKAEDLEEGEPTDHKIGEGVYDYLREFPDCLNNVVYAELLKNGYAHYIADLAAHTVMLDQKDVEAAYDFRKLTYMKILCLLEPDNSGLLWQLCKGFYDLAMTFTELPKARRYLLDSMRYGQAVIKSDPDNMPALNILAEIDILFGDYPTAIARFSKLLELTSAETMIEKLQGRIECCVATGMPDHPLVDDLERMGEGMQLFAAGNYLLATEILERLEEDTYFMSELVSADYYCLLGMCRIKTGDSGGAFDALSKSIELDPDHAQAQEQLQTIYDS